ncbi:methylmalonyl-CoA carboxyltransferase [Iamia sp. SCSIO 61187]|uniref:acyl-CoA carboxylase subunit beta n=1 Tax=Iamia sp. SCSIO 61187 TaxID=2722752 RepID=UPI001C625CA5|nr:carboxyl transferase domain-containing protein [Iamia sp. SCSIO 61187]QYG92056.1 methylmalonyl-CoA carboxyltransferase [Iamia sp. SCSIO 61187]
MTAPVAAPDGADALLEAAEAEPGVATAVEATAAPPAGHGTASRRPARRTPDPTRSLPEPGLDGPSLGPPTAIGADRPGIAGAGLIEVDGRTVSYFEVGGGRWSTRDAVAEAEVVERALLLGADLGVPVLGVVHSLALDPADLAGLAVWGRVARAAVRASGAVPLLLAVTGGCHGGLSTILGLADHVVLTREASVYVNGPAAVRAVTAVEVTPDDLGGAAAHHRDTGLASLVADDRDDAIAALADLLAYHPSSWDTPLPPTPSTDPPDRPCHRAARVVPTSARASYDVRDVLDDIADEGSVLEVRAGHAPNVVTAFARLGGRPVAVVANQPQVRAGTLDIAAGSKAARHVQAADAAGIPLLTLVDTPGFEPGKDLEWRGMIRHGAELVHAYCAATVPRVCVVLRKSYGGAYIVMDSRDIGSDLVLAWPTAEIAVMGAPGAVAILNRREIAASDDPEATRAELIADYEARFCTPAVAAERGYVDQVIAPEHTRAHLVAAFARLAPKRPRLVERRHSVSPC